MRPPLRKILLGSAALLLLGVSLFNQRLAEGTLMTPEVRPFPL
jgi:hypothetical protein